MEDAYNFLNYVNDNYDYLYHKLEAFCNDKKHKFDEDIFQDTIIKCYERIDKQGKMIDSSQKGMENYLFMAFKINVLREKQYSRNAKRDGNILDLTDENERYQNSFLTEREKLLSDLKKDFSTLYLMRVIEEKFPPEHFYLFKLKVFEPHMTYKRLQEKTNIPGARQKVIDCKNYLKQNVKKEDIDKLFNELYGDFFQ